VRVERVRDGLAAFFGRRLAGISTAVAVFTVLGLVARVLLS
jgi:hypothetical protein